MNLAKQQWAQMRRARIAGARVERVSFKAVLARDGLVCGICHKDVADDELSFDHIVPIAAGGEHSMANLQVAHLRCNIRKSGPRRGVQPPDATIPICRDCGAALSSWVQERCRPCASTRKRVVLGLRWRQKNRVVLAAKQRARELGNPATHSKSKPVALMTPQQHARRIEQWAAYRARRRAA